MNRHRIRGMRPGLRAETYSVSCWCPQFLQANLTRLWPFSA
jgi:hypothetical protein